MDESNGVVSNDNNDSWIKRVDAVYICSQPCEAIILPYTSLERYLQHYNCKYNSALQKEEKEYKIITRYDLIKLYLFCGVKQYWVDRVVERVIHDLVQECELLEEWTLSHEEEKCHKLEHELEEQMENIKQERQSEKSQNSDFYYSKRLIIVMHDKLFNSVCARVLRLFLRGQFITLYSLYRWEVAQEVTLHKEISLIILCGGTSGSGKSTLAALIASQLHISLIVSTDTIRQVLRTQYAHNINNNKNQKEKEKIHEILQLSSYDPIEINGAFSKENDYQSETESGNTNTSKSNDDINEENDFYNEEESAKMKERVEQHYFEQCSYILPVLHKVIAQNVEAGHSMVIEGVHLHPRYMAQVQEAVGNFNNNNNNGKKKRAICVAVLLRIAKEERHRERFAIRAKSMSLSPQVNKYVAKFDNIRIIQKVLERQVKEIQGGETNNTLQQEKQKYHHNHLGNCFEKSWINNCNSVLSINNTNVDKSWMILHCKILTLLESYKLAQHVKAKRSVEDEMKTKKKEQDNIADNAQLKENCEEEVELEDNKSEYKSNNVAKQFVYSHLSSKRALQLLHEQKLNKQQNKRKSAEQQCEEKSLLLLETERHYNKKCTFIDKENAYTSSNTTNTVNRTISVPAHITFRSTSKDKIDKNNVDKENCFSKHKHSKNLECITTAYNVDNHKENSNLQVQRKFINNCKNDKTTNEPSRNTLVLHRPLTQSHSQSVFMQSARHCTNILLCDELSSNVNMEEAEVPSLTNSINEHVHLSLSSTS